MDDKIIETPDGPMTWAEWKKKNPVQIPLRRTKGKQLPNKIKRRTDEPRCRPPERRHFDAQDFDRVRLGGECHQIVGRGVHRGAAKLRGKGDQPGGRIGFVIADDGYRPLFAVQPESDRARLTASAFISDIHNDRQRCPKPAVRSGIRIRSILVIA